MSCFIWKTCFFSIALLVILILVSQRAEVQVVLLLGTDTMKQAMLEAMKKQRGNPPTPLELLLVLYVFGFIWQETQEIFSEGIRSYLRNMWNFIDFSRNSLYCFVFLFRCVAFLQQMNQIDKDPTTAFIPRERWDDFDPQLIVTYTLRCFFHLKELSNFRLKDFLQLLTSSPLSSLFTCFPLILTWDRFKFPSVGWLLI